MHLIGGTTALSLVKVFFTNFFSFPQALFENPDFEVDREAEEYRLLNPVLSRLDKNKDKKMETETSMQVTISTNTICI